MADEKKKKKESPQMYKVPSDSDTVRDTMKIAGGIMSAPDNLLWAGLTPNKSIKKELENIFNRDFPDSVLENGTEAEEFLEEVFDADKSKTSTKALAFIMNAAGPGAGVKAISKIIGKELPSGIAQAMVKKFSQSKYGKDNFARQALEKMAKEKEFEAGQIGPMLQAIKEDDLYTKLRNPEELKDYLSGKMSSDAPRMKERREGGRLGDLGREIFDTAKEAEVKKSLKISRQGMARDLMNKQFGVNKSTDTTISFDTEKMREFLDRRLKHTTSTKVPMMKPRPAPPETPPTFESIIPEIDSKLAGLTKEYDTATKTAKEISAQKAAREAAEKSTAKKNTGVLTDKQKEVEKEIARRKKNVEQSKVEREAAEKEAEQLNLDVTEYNNLNAAEIADLKRKLKIKSNPPKPVNPRPIPTVTKKGEPAAMKRILDTKRFNEKAKVTNKLYEESKNYPSVQSLQEMIETLKGTKLKPTAHADDFAPPALPEEIINQDLPEFDELALLDDVDTPPPMPNMNRPIEDILADIQDVKNTKNNLGKGNAKLAAENASKTKKYEKELADASKTTFTRMDNDVVSSPTELLKLRRELDVELSSTYAKPDKLLTLDERVEKGKVLALRREIDTKIKESLDGVQIDKGDAGQVFDELNTAHGARKDLSKLASREGQKDRQKLGWVAESLPAAGTGLVAGGVATAAGQSSVWPIASSIGFAAGDAMWRKNGPEYAAGALRNMEDPFKGGAYIGAAEELGEYFGERQSSATPINPLPDSPQPEVDWSFIKQREQKEREKLRGRGPNSVVPMPEEQTQTATDIMAPSQDINEKMERHLNPEKPLFDPYTNEKILNTPLPRDTQRILQNPQAVKAKLGQLAPQYLPMLEDTITNDPETFKESLPKLAMMFPDAFEKDKYGLFDGKVSPDPMLQQKFFQDLEDDEGMDSIQKAEMAMRAHRGLSIYGDQV